MCIKEEGVAVEGGVEGVRKECWEVAAVLGEGGDERVARGHSMRDRKRKGTREKGVEEGMEELGVGKQESLKEEAREVRE